MNHKRRLIIGSLTGAITSLAGCSALGVSNPFTGSVKVERISVTTVDNTVSEPAAGMPWEITIDFTNPGGASAEDEIDVSVNGEVVETLAISLEGGESAERSVEHVLGKVGENTISAGDHTERIELTKRVDLSAEYEAVGQYAVTPERSNGLAGALFLGKNKSDFRVPFMPDVQVGDKSIENLRYYSAGLPGQSFDGVLEGNSYFAIVVQTEVPPDKKYEVSVNGDTIGTVNLASPETPYRYGVPDRSGAPIPFHGIGHSPGEVTQFRINKPSNVPEGVGIERNTPVAVSGDRLYVTCRWGNNTGTVGAYHRWTGEQFWHQVVEAPGEIAATDGVEYLLDGGSLTATTVDGEELWERKVYSEGYGGNGQNMVPTKESLFVGTPEGVRVIDTETGDVVRTLEGRYPIVTESAVFTWEETVLRRHDRDSSEVMWQTNLEREETGFNRFGDEGTHEYVEYGAASSETVILTSYVEDGEDTRFLAHAYDAENGTELWRRTLVKAESVATDRKVRGPSDSITRFGGKGKASRLPEITQPTIRNGRLFVGTTYGLKMYTLEGGDEQSFVNNGYYPTVASRTTVYSVNEDGLYAQRLVRNPENLDSEPTIKAEAANERQTLENGVLFGRDALYFAVDGNVYVAGGTIPDTLARKPNEGKDLTGRDQITIKVGAGPANRRFDPAVVRIDTGTTVTWEWTGNGGMHNVVEVNHQFIAEASSEPGHTFERTFEKPGEIEYYCPLHEDTNPGGTIIVED